MELVYLVRDHRPQGAFDNRAEEGMCRSIYLFTGIPVTIYSTIELIELYDSIIVLGQPLKIRNNPGGTVE